MGCEDVCGWYRIIEMDLLFGVDDEKNDICIVKMMMLKMLLIE